MVKIAIIGYGYWGPNIVRNFSSNSGATITWICDQNKDALKHVPRYYPTIRVTTNVNDVLHDTHIDAIAVVTPASTHFAIAQKALKSGKHVLVEKPLAITHSQAKSLVSLARSQKKILMVDHTFIYTPAVAKMREIINNGDLGKVYYIDSVRTNLGNVQKDTNVIYDLASHDFSILDWVLGATPQFISASGITHKTIGQEQVAHVNVQYKGNLSLHCHVSWISPVKIRRFMVIGTKKMLLYDDMEPSEKIQIYDRGVSVENDTKGWYQLRIGYRMGDMLAPYLPIGEALSSMSKDFIDAITKNTPPKSDGALGSRIVQMLEASTHSLRNGGKRLLL